MGKGKRKRSASATLETSNHGGREDQTLREGQDCQLHEKQERDASQDFSSRDRRRREQGGDSFLPGKEGRLHLQGSDEEGRTKRTHQVQMRLGQDHPRSRQRRNRYGLVQKA